MEPYHSKIGVRVITTCCGATKTGIFEQIASFDEDITMKELTELNPIQRLVLITI